MQKQIKPTKLSKMETILELPLNVSTLTLLAVTNDLLVVFSVFGIAIRGEALRYTAVARVISSSDVFGYRPPVFHVMDICVDCIQQI